MTGLSIRSGHNTVVVITGGRINKVVVRRGFYCGCIFFAKMNQTGSKSRECIPSLAIIKDSGGIKMAWDEA